MEDIRKKINNLLSIRKDIVKEIAENIDRIKGEALEDKTKYATKFDWLGVFCPSLVLDKVTSGYKKGRLLTKQPKSTDYKKCYFNDKGDVLYFETYNKYGCASTTYFMNINGALWAVPFIRDGKKAYPSYVHYMVYENGRIKEYAYMEPCDIWFEEYVYSEETDKVVCNQYYYVQQKKRGILQSYRANLLMEKNKVKNLFYYEIGNGAEILKYVYEK